MEYKGPFIDKPASYVTISRGLFDGYGFGFVDDGSELDFYYKSSEIPVMAEFYPFGLKKITAKQQSLLDHLSNNSKCIEGAILEAFLEFDISWIRSPKSREDLKDKLRLVGAVICDCEGIDYIFHFDLATKTGIGTTIALDLAGNSSRVLTDDEIEQFSAGGGALD